MNKPSINSIRSQKKVNNNPGPGETGREDHSFLTILSILILFLLTVIPFLETLLRKLFSTGIPGASDYMYHLVLWITFLGGVITSREDKHLSLRAGVDLLSGRTASILNIAEGFISVLFISAFALTALSFILLGFDPDSRTGIFPVQVITAVMPAGFIGMAFFSLRSIPGNRGKILAGTAIIPGIILAFPAAVNILSLYWPDMPMDFYSFLDSYYAGMAVVSGPLILVMTVAAFLGIPIFIVLGGIGYLLFAGAGAPLEILPNEAYTVLTGSSLPAIPLFTLAGFVLSESRAGERLVRLFQALLGWLPGGLAILAVAVSAFFTTFTGASGVTILALGALLSFMLTKSGGYSKNFSTGLLTASGSIGLLFPPSLPIILYGVVAQVSIRDMFVGGLLPGLLLVSALSAAGVATAIHRGMPRRDFSIKEITTSLKEAVWEIFLPLTVLVAYFRGITTIAETAALAAVFALIIETLIHRDLHPKDLIAVSMKSISIIGGILIIMAMAKGLSYYLVDAEIPMRFSHWVTLNISSKYVFLILLNLALLITGCLMDIFSAIIVVVPLITPLGEVFGIHPVHLGIIFLANLELGYLTPPVGLNLFLASYRFEEPLLKIYRNVLPFFLILLILVLLITYVPLISTFFLG